MSEERNEYILVGSKRPGDTTVAVRHFDQFVPLGEKILLSDEDYDRLKDSFQLDPVAKSPEPTQAKAVPAKTPVVKQSLASVPRDTIPVKPSPDENSPSTAL